MPFTFAQPIDLGGLPPLPSQPIKEGPKAPPLTPQRSVLNSQTGFVVRRSTTQWSLDEAKELLRKFFIPSSNPNHIPEAPFLNLVANAVFNTETDNAFYETIKKGIPVYRPELDEIIRETLQRANRYGQHFAIQPNISLVQHMEDKLA